MSGHIPSRHVKYCMVSTDVVAIPVAPEIKWWEPPYFDPSAVVDIQKRYVHLVPHVFEGRSCKAAYDQETDTLFIKEN